MSSWNIAKIVFGQIRTFGAQLGVKKQGKGHHAHSSSMWLSFVDASNMSTETESWIQNLLISLKAHF
jgi:hypothetical protein